MQEPTCLELASGIGAACAEVRSYVTRTDWGSMEVRVEVAFVDRLLISNQCQKVSEQGPPLTKVTEAWQRSAGVFALKTTIMSLMAWSHDFRGSREKARISHRRRWSRRLVSH